MCPEFSVAVSRSASRCAGNKLSSGTMAKGSARSSPVPNKGPQPWRAQPLDPHRAASDSGCMSVPGQL